MGYFPSLISAKFKRPRNRLKISEISSTGLVKARNQLVELSLAATVRDDGLEDLLLVTVTELPVHQAGRKAGEIPLLHVLGRPEPAHAGVEPTEVLQTHSVQETSQCSHVESLGHLPETDEDCLQI